MFQAVKRSDQKEMRIFCDQKRSGPGSGISAASFSPVIPAFFVYIGGGEMTPREAVIVAHEETAVDDRDELEVGTAEDEGEDISLVAHLMAQSMN